ncbi:hypothetical protein OIV83_003187 [Microbotryomycetes sp. JL201]|nr:hypothetical protein OIV83_003187 [Microbotryomycetes sp. JL201]
MSDDDRHDGCDKTHPRALDRELCRHGFTDLVAPDTEFVGLSEVEKKRELRRWIALFGFSVLGWEKTFEPAVHGHGQVLLEPIPHRQRHLDFSTAAVLRRKVLEGCIHLLNAELTGDQVSEKLETLLDEHSLAETEKAAIACRLKQDDLDQAPWSFFFALTFDGLQHLLPLRIEAFGRKADRSSNERMKKAWQVLDFAVYRDRQPQKPDGIGHLTAAELIAVLLLTQGWTGSGHHEFYEWLELIEAASSLSHHDQNLFKSFWRRFAIESHVIPQAPSPSSHALHHTRKSSSETCPHREHPDRHLDDVLCKYGFQELVMPSTRVNVSLAQRHDDLKRLTALFALSVLGLEHTLGGAHHWPKFNGSTAQENDLKTWFDLRVQVLNSCLDLVRDVNTFSDAKTVGLISSFINLTNLTIKANKARELKLSTTGLTVDRWLTFFAITRGTLASKLTRQIDELIDQGADENDDIEANCQAILSEATKVGIDRLSSHSLSVVLLLVQGFRGMSKIKEWETHASEISSMSSTRFHKFADKFIAILWSPRPSSVLSPALHNAQSLARQQLSPRQRSIYKMKRVAYLS